MDVFPTRYQAALGLLFSLTLPQWSAEQKRDLDNLLENYSKTLSKDEQSRLDWWRVGDRLVKLRASSKEVESVAYQILFDCVFKSIARNPTCRSLFSEFESLKPDILTPLMTKLVSASLWYLAGHSNQSCSEFCRRPTVPHNVLLLLPVPPGELARGQELCKQPLMGALQSKDSAQLLSSVSQLSNFRFYPPHTLHPELLMGFARFPEDDFDNRFGLWQLPVPPLPQAPQTCPFAVRREGPKSRESLLRNVRPDEEKNTAGEYFHLSHILQSISLQRKDAFHIVFMYGCRGACTSTCVLESKDMVTEVDENFILAKSIRVVRDVPSVKRQVPLLLRRKSDAGQADLRLLQLS